MTYDLIKRVSFAPVSLSVPILVAVFVHIGVYSVIYSFRSEAMADEIPFSLTNAQTVPLLRAALHADPNLAKGGGDILVEDGALVSQGDISEKDNFALSKTANGEISVYVVREGDTLSQIAEMYNVSSKTVLWANDIASASLIRPGDTLVILPITGVRHIVKKGDTIASIAKKYSGDVSDILSFNQLASASDIQVGDTLVIPDGTIANPAPKRGTTKAGGSLASGAGFSNPLPGSVKTQGIHGYNGVDLSGVPVGTSVLAALGGEVIVAKGSGWNGGYGSYVVIKHANGTQTLYGHLSSVYVTVGQKVSTGTAIGGMGNTGRSTGPHLHFEVRGAKNPF